MNSQTEVQRLLEKLWDLHQPELLLYKDQYLSHHRDFEFCSLLSQRGVDIPFTTFDEEAAMLNKQYWGLLLQGTVLES